MNEIIEETHKPDLDVLLGLLEDYAEKLQARLEARQKTRLLSKLVLTVGCLLTILTLLYIVGNPAALTSPRTLGILILEALGSALPILSSLFIAIQLFQRSSREAQEVYRLRSSLETLVRRASQIEDRGKADFTRRIALDLRLAEAEATLKYSRGLPSTEGSSPPKRATGYDWKGLAVIRALLNPRFSKSRTTSGLAFDSGLTVNETMDYLRQMQRNGDVEAYPGDPAKGDWWTLTTSGREKFADLEHRAGDMTVQDTGVQ